MSDLSCMLAQRIIPDLFWSALVLAVILALTRRIRTSRPESDGRPNMGQFLSDLTGGRRQTFRRR